MNFQGGGRYVDIPSAEIASPRGSGDAASSDLGLVQALWLDQEGSFHGAQPDLQALLVAALSAARAS